jgi:hypothetical protein
VPIKSALSTFILLVVVNCIVQVIHPSHQEK